MKKILFVVESLAGGGAEKVLLTLIKNIDKEKYDITVFTVVETGIYVDELKKYCRVKSALKDYKEYSFLGKIFYRIKCKLIYKVDARLIYRFLIKDKYDVEIAFVEGFDTKLVAASSNKKSKKMAWLHIDMLNNTHADVHYKNIEEEKNTYLQFDKIYAVSEDVKNKFIEKFEIKNVKVQYNPVDSIEIITKSNQKGEILDKDKVCMVTIGRLEKQKGYDRLLRIIKKLKEDKYQIKLYILGEGSLKADFQKYVIENRLSDYVSLLGFKENPYMYLRQADFFVCSSYTEGFSTVATEALILGVPLITTECSGMQELFGESECGIICDNDENELYEAIKKVLDDQECLKHYKDEINKRKVIFDIEIRMREIERILDEENINNE